MKPARLVACLFLLTFASFAVASDGVLIPIFYGGPGAFGSLWRTRLAIFNNSDQPLKGITFNSLCPIPEGCLAPIPPKSSLTLIASDGFRYINGFLLYPGIDQPDVWYSLRVYDESRAGANFGTDVPAVPLDSFSERQLQLLGVPTGSAFRVTLRVYAIPPVAPRVRVAVFQDTELSSAQAPPAILVRERIYTVEPSPFGPSSGSYSRPSGIVVGDLFDGLPSGLADAVRIEVQSATPGVPIWAFASVTNNATQLVTVVVPRSSP